MAFTYSADLSDATSRVRQTIGDVVDAGHLVEDETIAYYLTAKPSELAVALQLANDLMARFATAVDQTVDGQGLKASQRYQQFKNLSLQLAQQLASAGAAAAAGSDADFSGVGVFGATAQEVVDGRCDPTAPTNLPAGSAFGPRRGYGWGSW